MKITGAIALDSTMDISAPEVSVVSGADQAYEDMVVRDSVLEGRKREDKKESDAPASHNVHMSVDEGVMNGDAHNEELDQNYFDVHSAMEGDEDFLDLLVETLDEEFDPNLLV